MVIVRTLIYQLGKAAGLKGSIPEPLWVVESPASRNTGGRVARETEYGRAEVRESRVVKATLK